MALAVGLRADVNVDAAVIRELDLRGLAFVAEYRFDVVADADAAQLAVGSRFRLARVEAGHVGFGFGASQHAREFADIEGLPSEVPIGEFLRRNEVPPAQFERVDAERPGGVVHQPLDHVDRLGSARAAVGVNGRRVGVVAPYLEKHRRDVVNAREDLLRDLRLDRLTEVRILRAEIAVGFGTVGQKLEILVECGLDQRDKVSSGIVQQHRFRSARLPMHRPPGDARCVGDGKILRIHEALHSEAAADVRRFDVN